MLKKFMDLGWTLFITRGFSDCVDLGPLALGKSVILRQLSVVSYSELCLPNGLSPSKMCSLRVRQRFVQRQQLTLALCLVARFTLYLHYFIAFSQASNV